jgi:hypothetical protein
MYCEIDHVELEGSALARPKFCEELIRPPPRQKTVQLREQCIPGCLIFSKLHSSSTLARICRASRTRSRVERLRTALRSSSEVFSGMTLVVYAKVLATRTLREGATRGRGRDMTAGHAEPGARACRPVRVRKWSSHQLGAFGGAPSGRGAAGIRGGHACSRGRRVEPSPAPRSAGDGRRLPDPGHGPGHDQGPRGRRHVDLLHP